MRIFEKVINKNRYDDIVKMHELGKKHHYILIRSKKQFSLYLNVHYFSFNEFRVYIS